ncbi:hypothetical protein [Mycobacterium hubeiense]|uniref:hypothetical protein n=1 Tax=Mycobacterium hubeiense TaxID=1867256 RepID=UPI001E3A373D|nr:hypothetical protein [Mycobacterium sp. QGD 101]
MTIQYDLFGEVEAAHMAAEAASRARSAAAAAFLASTPWPPLLGWWLHSEAIEAMLDHGEARASFRRSQHDRPGWAWAIWRDGLRFEAEETWLGWGHRPQWCIPWQELHRLRDAHPAVTERLAGLADGRGHPRSAGWRWWTDPHCLTDGWHPDSLTAEQQPDWYVGCARPATAWNDRLEAWRLVLDVVATATLDVTIPRAR